jgi:tetratricopeptide (TPR) repeat protein
MCYLKLGSYRNAAVIAEEALKISAGNRKALFRVAQAYKALGEYKKAYEAMRVVIENGGTAEEIEIYKEIKSMFSK